MKGLSRSESSEESVSRVARALSELGVSGVQIVQDTVHAIALVEPEEQGSHDRSCDRRHVLLGMVEVMALRRGQKGQVVATVVVGGRDDDNCEP